MKKIFSDPPSELPTVTLRPSQFFVARTPTRIVTLLGSCVAVCLCDRQRGMGAMCHGFLPEDRARCRNREECGRFVDSAIHWMVRELVEECGCTLSRIEARVFGGASIFGAAVGRDVPFHHVGMQNIEVARQVIRQYGLRLLSGEVGGRGGYKVFFESHTGKVFWRPLRSLAEAQRNSLRAAL